MKAKKPQVQTAIRLPPELLKRLDRLAEQKTQPGAPAATRASILRFAAELGVAELEKKKR